MKLEDKTLKVGLGTIVAVMGVIGAYNLRVELGLFARPTSVELEPTFRQVHELRTNDAVFVKEMQHVQKALEQVQVGQNELLFDRGYEPRYVYRTHLIHVSSSGALSLPADLDGDHP